jgi:hypothetical protein
MDGCGGVFLVVFLLLLRRRTGRSDWVGRSFTRTPRRSSWMTDLVSTLQNGMSRSSHRAQN